MSEYTDPTFSPDNIPKQMSKAQLEWWILFTIAVAGKTAKTIEVKMRAFLQDMEKSFVEAIPNYEKHTPFGLVQSAIIFGRLGHFLRKHKTGKYKLLNRGYRKAINLDLDALSYAAPANALPMLTAIPGLGPKGARMVLMYAFPHHANQWVVLDVHILRWLREQGYDAPKATPPEGPTYARLEKAFKAECEKRNLTTRQLDTDIWLKYSRK